MCGTSTGVEAVSETYRHLQPSSRTNGLEGTPCKHGPRAWRPAVGAPGSLSGLVDAVRSSQSVTSETVGTPPSHVTARWAVSRDRACHRTRRAAGTTTVGAFGMRFAYLCEAVGSGGLGTFGHLSVVQLMQGLGPGSRQRRVRPSTSCERRTSSYRARLGSSSSLQRLGEQAGLGSQWTRMHVVVAP